MPKPPGQPSDLINNDPIPSGCKHRNTTLTVIEIDNGDVTSCDFCRTNVMVREYGGEIPTPGTGCQSTS